MEARIARLTCPNAEAPLVCSMHSALSYLMTLFICPSPFSIFPLMFSPCLTGRSATRGLKVTFVLASQVTQVNLFLRLFFFVLFFCGIGSNYDLVPGRNCETNIDECSSNPCFHGECIDGIAEYECKCDPGYEGPNCKLEIDECERWKPCQNGAICQDRIADYKCQCPELFGGKNCSVALTGCDTVTCLNKGICKPWLLGETDHRANCTCTDGYHGERCQSRTTVSLFGNSYIRVPSSRREGYELHMKFRTTLGSGIVAIGQGNTHFSLILRNGKLNLHSNLISKYEGIMIGENLNNTYWQKVYVAVNSSHLTLGVNDRLQATHPINPTGENDTVFEHTYLGGIVYSQIILANNAPGFTGCMQDIVVNDMRITEADFSNSTTGTHINRGVEEVNTNPGCPREDQCSRTVGNATGINPCQNEGVCFDLWNNFQCSCHRPFLGPSCQFNYTGATFGYENTTNSIASVNIVDPVPYRSGVDISMFIRTREREGFIFYLGADPFDNRSIGGERSSITCQMTKGNLVVRVTEKPEKFQVYTVDLSDGYRHFIRVVRRNNSIAVKVNESVSINHDFPAAVFHAERLYLGNYPTRPTPNPTTTPLPTLTSSSTSAAPSPQVFEAQPVNEVESPVVQLNPTEQPNPDLFANDIPGTEPPSVSELNEEREEPLTATTGPSTPQVRLKRAVDSPTRFKGIIQDVQLSDGQNRVKIVEMFKQDFGKVKVSKPPPVGIVTTVNVQMGVVSDDTCRNNPCLNGGRCEVTWNDYRCQCPPGYKGRDCGEKEYCHWFKCPRKQHVPFVGRRLRVQDQRHL